MARVLQRTIEPQKQNLIINGNFDIWQRGTSFPSIGVATYNADRFQYSKSGDMVHDISQSTDVPTQAESGFQSAYSLLVDCTTVDSSITAGDHAYIRQMIEGLNASPIYGKTFTLSFWVKATKTGTYCVGFVNGPAGTRSSYVSEYTVNASDVWEKKTITVTHDLTGTWATDNTVGLQVFWSLAVGPTYQTTADSWQTGVFFATANQVNACDSTANNFRIAQAQINEGASAISFRRAGNDISEELAMCQRYYVNLPKVSLASYASAVFHSTYSSIVFPSTMRAIPTMTLGSATAGSGNVFVATTTDTSVEGTSFTLQSSASGYFYYYVASLVANAEL